MADARHRTIYFEYPRILYVLVYSIVWLPTLILITTNNIASGCTGIIHNIAIIYTVRCVRHYLRVIYAILVVLCVGRWIWVVWSTTSVVCSEMRFKSLHVYYYYHYLVAFSTAVWSLDWVVARGFRETDDDDEGAVACTWCVGFRFWRKAIKHQAGRDETWYYIYIYIYIWLPWLAIK